MSLQNIRKIIRDGYDYIIIPKTFKDTPIELPDFIKEDANGNDIVGEYYTARELHKIFGKQFEFSKMPKTKFVGFRWSIDCKDMQDYKTFFKSKNLSDMRRDANNVHINTKDIDFKNLDGTQFSIFPKLKFKKVLNMVTLKI